MSNKDKVLKDAIKKIEKEFWKWSIMKMWNEWWYSWVETFHSGSYMLNWIIWWGYPRGRIVEIFGPQSSGKTTFALHAIAEIQKEWGIAAFVDAEHAMDPKYAKEIGINVDDLLLSQPDFGEQALQITQELAKTWAVDLIVIDSVSALTPKAEVEGDMGDSHVGLQARMMSQALRKLTSILAKTGTTVMFINQIRMKIWVLYGNPETTSGGNALRFFASQRIEIRRGKEIKRDKESFGYEARFKVKKNKIAPPFKKAQILVKFNHWVEEIEDMIDAGLKFGVIDRKWAYYYLSEDENVQWKSALADLLRENDDKREKVEKDIQKAIKEMRGWNSDNEDDKNDKDKKKDKKKSNSSKKNKKGK